MSTIKIERLDRMPTDGVALVVPLSPDVPRAAMGVFVDYYDRRRYHEPLDNVTPNDVHYGRKEATVARRKQLRVRTLVAQRVHYGSEVEMDANPGAGTPKCTLIRPLICPTNGEDVQPGADARRVEHIS